MADPVSIIGLIISVASAVYSATRTVPDPSNEDIGANVVKQGSASPRNVVYGRTRVSSTKLYSNVLDTNNEYMIQVFAIGGIGRLTSIHQCWIEDKQTLASDVDLLTDPTKDHEGFCSNVPEYEIPPSEQNPNPPSWPVYSKLSSDFGDQVALQFRNGAPTERASELAIKYGDDEWTIDHRGDLVPHVVVRVKRDISSDGIVITSPQYKIQCEVSGVKVYDPRNNTTAWSDNPGLCLLDYLTAGSVLSETDRYYGMAIPVEYVNVQSFIDAANFCDSNGLKINAEIQGDQTYGDILDKFLSTFEGILTIENGQITCKFEQIELPVQSFNEDNIVGNFGYTNQSTSNYHNAVSVSYKSWVNAEEKDEFIIPANFYTDPIIASDGYIKRKTVDMPYSIDAYTVDGLGNGNVIGPAKWRANRELVRSQFQKEVTFDVDLIETPIFIYDVISVSNPEYRLSDKLFRVKVMKKAVDQDKLNVATITASEYDPSVYTGNQDGNGSKPKPDPIPIASPTDMNMDVASFISSGYGTLSWQCLYNSQHRLFDVEYKLSSVTGWTRLGSTENLNYKIANLRSDTYDFRVKTRDPYKGSSEWSELLNETIGTTITIPPVTSLAVDATTRNFRWYWDDMLGIPYTSQVDPDAPDSPTNGLINDIFSHYRVDIFHDENGSWVLKSQYNSATPEFIYTFELNKLNNLNRRVRADVYIVAKDNTVSQLGTARVIGENIQINTQPSGVGVKSDVAQIWVDWLTSDDPDFSGTEIHFSDTPNFTPSPSTLQTVTQGTFYNWVWPAGSNNIDPKPTMYIRLGHFDAFGKDNITFSPEYMATYRSIDNEITPFDPSQLESDLDTLDKTINGDPTANPPTDGLVGDIAANKNLIDQNALDITANKNLIDQNALDVAANKNLIDQNALDITANKNLIDQTALDLDGLSDGISEYIPNVSNTLVSLRDANNAPVDSVTGLPIQERINLVTSQDKTKTAGYAIEAKNGQRSRFIIAADDLVIGGGKGSTTTDDQRAFYWDSTAGRAYIENASIVNLDAANIKAGAITSTQIATGTITASNIAAGTITSTQIAAGTIQASDIKSGTITSTQIAAGTITAADIAAGTITSTQIAAGTIQASDIGAGQITTNLLAAGAITTAKISANAIETNQIAAGAVSAAKIQVDAITGDKFSASSYLEIGGGSTASWIDARKTDFRFWIGATEANRASAPFRVTPAGEMTARGTVTAGTGNTSATMSGVGSYRIWAGHADSASAPFRVSQTGQVDIRSSISTTTSRLVINGDRLEVYEGSTLKVRIGRL